MDYFGIEDFIYKKNDKKNKTSFEELNSKKCQDFSMKKRDVIINGFGCQNVYCSNREARFGTIYLPFCNENKKCMKKNIEYLLLENAKLKGQIKEFEEVSSMTPMTPMNFMADMNIDL
jgi:hypothetical protein